MCTTRIYNKITLLLLLLLTVCSLSAEPRLTVVIAVDGLSTSSLQMLQPYWQQGGLRTLSEEAMQSAVNYPHEVYGGIESLTTLLTGETPSVHSIASNQRFDKQSRTIIPILEDKQTNGIGSALQLSPRNILCPTLTDYMRMQHGSNAKLFAIGIDAKMTIVMAGHAANACCWLETDEQRWATTNYCRQGLPATADKMNISGRIKDIATATWTPRMDIQTYLAPTEQEKKKSFTYLNSDVLANSPAANKLVIELALDIQKSENLGMDNIPDMLLLQLTTISPKAKSDIIQSAEQEDMYLWLNQDIGYLIEQLNKRIGKDNYQIIMLGLPRYGNGKQKIEIANFAVNEFNLDRATALTSSYLMALYGHERWIDGSCNNTIYLNHKLIEQKNLSLTQVAQKVAHFLLEFDGVSEAYTADDAKLIPSLYQEINKHNIGDVVFRLQPYYQLRQSDKIIIDNVIEPNPISPIWLWSPARRTYPAKPNTAKEVIKLIL